MRLVRLFSIVAVPALLVAPPAVRLSQIAPISVPAFTAYIAPDAEGARVSRDRGVSNWRAAGTHVLWFGEFQDTGSVNASVTLRIPAGRVLPLKLTVGGMSRDAVANSRDSVTRVDFGAFNIPRAGYVKFDLTVLDTLRDAQISALILDGAPAGRAHFNLVQRRNAASVHLRYPVDTSLAIVGFYNEVTAVEDPVTTYYMACGFARGYFGMQVNSPTERRIIFSVWDAGAGTNAQDRSGVAATDQTQLLGKGPGVEASVFGNEGTGGHSHLVYNWKTGSTQRFYVAVSVNGTNTDYSGYWFNPDANDWQLIASFRAPKDGKTLRGLYSFSENFGGSTGHLLRRANFGPQWIRLANGEWRELTRAVFTHDVTGRADRFDRFGGVDGNKFFLSHGGFVQGFTATGSAFTRAATAAPPEFAQHIAERAHR